MWVRNRSRTPRYDRGVKKVKRGVRRVFGDRTVRRFKARRLRLAEAAGLERWSRPGLEGLDVRLAEHLGWVERGFFVEVGANDGIQQSNSYLLERELSWTGVLIEAVPALAAEAGINRPNCTVVCAAVSARLQLGHPIAMEYNDLVTKVGAGHRMTAATTLPVIWMDLVPLDASATLISLDVEGHELEVLEGVASASHRPDWILVETAQVDGVNRVLDTAYSLVAQLSRHDYLYKRN